MAIGRILLAMIFVIAGVLHFIFTPAYLRIVPGWLPAPRLLVQISGVCEVLGGVGLLIPETRRVAAWGLVALLIAVLPANFTMATDALRWPGIPAWLLWARVPMQLPLIFWAWQYTRMR